MNVRTVIAVRLTRSRIGMAVFLNERVEFARCLNLPYSNFESAAKSLRGMINRAIEQFKDSTIAVEDSGFRPESSSLESELHRLVKEQDLVLIAVPTKTLFAAYCFPSLSSRSQMRKIAAQIWPGIALLEKSEILDAAALALHVQTERLLTPNN